MSHNPQAEQMAHESMLRTLAAQANAIWPQEQHLFDRYLLPAVPRIIDVGCGSGEITARLAQRYPTAQLFGVDILESSVAYARRTHATRASGLQFVQGDAFQLEFEAAQFDLVVCRHMTQAIPHPERVLAELWRVCKPGGWIHVLSEDYGMLHMPGVAGLDPDTLWHTGVIPYTRATGTDARIGRRTWSLLHELQVEELHVDYIVVDTLRVPREIFAAIISAWRDGYTHALATHSLLSADQVRSLFDAAIHAITDPRRYAVWHVPVVSGRRIG